MPFPNQLQHRVSLTHLCIQIYWDLFTSLGIVVRRYRHPLLLGLVGIHTRLLLNYLYLCLSVLY